jgi:energy-coupling factor transporter ATP-binding protein EcfA2
VNNSEILQQSGQLVALAVQNLYHHAAACIGLAMIRKIHIKNFKSVQDVVLLLGRVNVFIGENGSGKSNLLEAVAFVSAAANKKLDNEFLASRGIRVVSPKFMRAAFAESSNQDVIIGVTADDPQVSAEFHLRADDGPYPIWRDVANESMSISLAGEVFKLNGESRGEGNSRDFVEKFTKIIEESLLRTRVTEPSVSRRSPAVEHLEPQELREVSRRVAMKLLENAAVQASRLVVPQFMIYSPENHFLRTFEIEGQVQPLGIRGEGLFKLLQSLAHDVVRWGALVESLSLLEWFEDIRISADLDPLERKIELRDKFISKEHEFFDQRSSNEGLLFILFYLALFLSPETPEFFAVDNVDVSLNPKLCAELMRRLVVFAADCHKQTILTTHNPAVLDGLNLLDDEQRLFVVSRDTAGRTRVHRVTAPRPLGKEPPVKLSEAFMRGILGGLPQNF